MFDALIQHQTSLHLLFQIVKEQQPKRHLPQDQNLVADAFYSEWWRMTGSNRRPPACKAGALPAELIPRTRNLVGLVGLEPTTPALSRRCSNQLSYRPVVFASRCQFNRPISVDANA